ncbi:hypothetical protein [Endozoicomonas sp. ONNA2]|uniref:hypothetical protein n=1 Tax=Endozoicomonas sp. ONNA2 TaxID=2828741 RepID=UPI0021496D52|nr:hypothetical protein [Endozoicomonas sp. ONNA2]
MMISGVSPPQQSSLPANGTVDSTFDSTVDSTVDSTTEVQKNTPCCRNITCQQTARGLCSRKIVGHDGAVSAGNTVKPLKRACPACPDLIPQKAAKTELSTVSQSSDRQDVDADPKWQPVNNNENRKTEAVRIYLQYKVKKIVEKVRLQFLMTTKEQKDKLKNKQKEKASVAAEIRERENSMCNPMHTMTHVIKQMLLDQSFQKLAALDIEVKSLTHALQDDVRKEVFIKRVSELAAQQMTACEGLPGGVQRLVDDYLKNQRWAELLPQDA